MLATILKRYWGHDRYLPLQEEAMQCILEGRDSLVVLPTGGGKSLCYQVPALCREGLAVVVSPLIALMKDQVDSLHERGVATAAVHSGLSADGKRRIADEIRKDRTRLLYLSPERLVAPRTLDFLASQRLSFFAIDEAHCISAWGHDFRPEYRSLSVLRQRFPDVGIHAYTATATEQIRIDIQSALGLRDPKVLVGDFFRPNLFYRVVRRERVVNQLCTLLDRFRGKSGLIYCISRAETEELSQLLTEAGYASLAYHAGLTDAERIERQNAFIRDQVPTIVATVAFGMGIDKPNVRFVVHVGMPRSLSHYQQEAGRAGRDGLPAECWLLYSPADLQTWQRMLESGCDEARSTNAQNLAGMYEYCVALECRHRRLVEYFGQPWQRRSCEACDICRGTLEQVEEPAIVAQKILSCVLRVRENFGGNYLAQVLTASRDRRILHNGHDRLSTYGLLREFGKTQVKEWIEQLVAQGYLQRQGEHQVIRVTKAGRGLLRGASAPKLMRPARCDSAASPTAIVRSWEGVDRGLYDHLLGWRQSIACQNDEAKSDVLSDATLRDLARRRPSSRLLLRDVHGIGEEKAARIGPELVRIIRDYCVEHQLAQDVMPEAPSPVVDGHGAISKSAWQTFPLWDQRMSVAEVAERLGRAESTVWDYLQGYLQVKGITEPAPWLSREEFDYVQSVSRYSGLARLTPIFQAVHGRIPYERIRIAVTLLKNHGFKALED